MKFNFLEECPSMISLIPNSSTSINDYEDIFGFNIRSNNETQIKLLERRMSSIEHIQDDDYRQQSFDSTFAPPLKPLMPVIHLTPADDKEDF